jgi:hypothetical protein
VSHHLPNHRVTHRTSRTIQHDYATSAQPTSHQRHQINNLNAHPRITIRWAADGRHTRCAMSISEHSTTEPIVDLGKRSTDAEH